MSNIRELSQLASVILVDNDTKNVGIGSTLPESKLSVNGDIFVSGIVTATSFSGDGSGLTGIGAGGTSNILTDSIVVSGVTTVTTISTIAGIMTAGILTTTSTSQTTLTSYPIDTYRSAKLNIQISVGSTHKITEILVIHDGVDSYITEYGSMTAFDTAYETPTAASFTSDIDSGNFRILATPTSSGLTTFKYIASIFTL